MRLHIVHILKIFCFINCFANDYKIFITSIPKSGTHLLMKCVKLITGKLPKHAIKLAYLNTDELLSLDSSYFLLTHAIHVDHYEALYLKNIRGLIIFRDPRDRLVARVHSIYTMPSVWPDLQKLNFNELLMLLINEPRLGLNHSHGLNSISSYMDYYNLYAPWIQNKSMYYTTFEKLVGPLGGGSLEVQIKEIINISEHLNIALDNERALNIANNLFGGTVTFREGKIGSWKKYFNEHHKTAFKRAAGNLLIELGYEKDNNW